MDLIDQLAGEPSNLLPYDGHVQYYGCVIAPQQASQLFSSLLKNIVWAHDQAVILGKTIVTQRKVAWYADQPFSYTYSHITKTALPWTNELLALKTTVEQACGETFNACLLNLYHDGSEGMGWHSDAEKDLKKNAAIASLSLGAERKFAFKHKRSKVSVSKTLAHGSLLVMKGVTQSHWMHRLPPTKTVTTPRINLTFRSIACGLANNQVPAAAQR